MALEENMLDGRSTLGSEALVCKGEGLRGRGETGRSSGGRRAASADVERILETASSKISFRCLRCLIVMSRESIREFWASKNGPIVINGQTFS
jgi:hypothetical protein